MQGIIEIPSGRYLFRDDHCHEPGIWAWNIDGEISDKMTTHKWGKFPKGAIVHLFELDNPPSTVPYVPGLEDY